MTVIQPMPEHHSLSNQFTSTRGSSELNFRNDTPARDNVTSIEIKEPGKHLVWFNADPKDNVAMALSILGVGRVTDEVEKVAQDRADMILDDNHGHSEAGVLRQAVINLRAILIAQERQKGASKADLKDAYNLYVLSYPRTTVTYLEFMDADMRHHWVSCLRKVRQDPTVLGAL